MAIDRPEAIWEDHKDSFDVVGIDEAQFFDASIVQAVTELADKGHRVVIAGLDLTTLASRSDPCPNCSVWQNMFLRCMPFAAEQAIWLITATEPMKVMNLIALGHQDHYEPVSEGCS